LYRGNDRGHQGQDGITCFLRRHILQPDPNEGDMQDAAARQIALIACRAETGCQSAWQMGIEQKSQNQAATRME
jgi:hypothetical protein